MWDIFLSQSLKCQSLIPRSKINNPAIGEAVLLDVVLHDTVVLMGVDANVCIAREAEGHDVFENTVYIRVAGNPILLLNFTLQESHFLGLLLIHQEIDGLAFIAEFALRVGYLCIDIHQIAHLFRDFSPYRELGL